jgi:hypothetical protein
MGNSHDDGFLWALASVVDKLHVRVNFFFYSYTWLDQASRGVWFA